MGATLLALTLVVPGMPVGVTLAGVVLLLAAMSAAALRLDATKRRQSLAWRVLGAVLIVSAALVAVVVHDLRSSGDVSDTLIGGAIRLIVVVAAVLFGVVLARARPPSSRRRASGGARDRSYEPSEQ